MSLLEKYPINLKFEMKGRLEYEVGLVGNCVSQFPANVEHFRKMYIVTQDKRKQEELTK